MWMWIGDIINCSVTRAGRVSLAGRAVAAAAVGVFCGVITWRCSGTHGRKYVRAMEYRKV